MAQYPELIEALLKSGAYPEAPPKIELMQTQMSFVILAGEYVYKIKKPVNLGYLDYTTLDKRKHMCQKEVVLNRRLCPDTYLGVFPVTQKDGVISLGGTGEILEYTVKMRYLPQSRMLNVLLKKNEVSEGMLTSVAEKLAGFHRNADTNSYINTFGSLEAVKVNTDENFRQTEKYIGITITSKSFDRLKTYSADFTSHNSDLFNDRITNGKIKDCHGDLHADHVCFVDGICIYDCIEFNDRFRYCDTASEVAFLAMDLDRYNRADLSRSFVNGYIAYSQDNNLEKLLNFYKCYRAYVRGKVECFKSDDPYISEQERQQAKNTAAGYFNLAESYVE